MVSGFVVQRYSHGGSHKAAGPASMQLGSTSFTEKFIAFMQFFFWCRAVEIIRLC